MAADGRLPLARCSGICEDGGGVIDDRIMSVGGRSPLTMGLRGSLKGEPGSCVDGMVDAVCCDMDRSSLSGGVGGSSTNGGRWLPIVSSATSCPEGCDCEAMVAVRNNLEKSICLREVGLLACRDEV
jgi:hypothetical protein